ncbi:MAG: helix-turn-helix transcriptional regulator, partial [Roseibium sp.]
MEPVSPNTEDEIVEANDLDHLGKMIREARQQKGWTLEEAGKAAGIGRSTLSKIENNQTRPSFDIV